MHPSSLLSYYPNYQILDEIVSYGSYKKLNIFIDLKNTLQTTYMEHAIVNIVESTKKSKYMDTSIFSSLVSFLTFHKIYGLKRGIEINFFVFFETGESYYHTNISKQYKINRRIDNLYGLEREDRELFYSVLHSNFQLIEKAGNKIPDVTVIRMPNFEADFIPYYLLSRKKIPFSSEIGNVVYSNDHDMWQVASKNCFIFSKSAKSKKIIKPGSIMSMFLGRKNDIEDIYLPLAMSVVGDTGDNVTGVINIGPSRFLEIYSQLVSLTGNIWEIYEKVENNKPLFEITLPTIQNKYLKSAVEAEVNDKTISNNLKMVSFELISRALDNPNTTEMLSKREYLENILNNKKVYPLESLKKALESTNVFLGDASLDLLYI